MEQHTEAAATNVQVAVRCRPLNEDEERRGFVPIVACDTEKRHVKISYGERQNPPWERLAARYDFPSIDLFDWLTSLPFFLGHTNNTKGAGMKKTTKNFAYDKVFGQFATQGKWEGRGESGQPTN